uniref:Ciliogenesis and planar polarity effector 2 n=1 Tax=Bigelowiella natans TaxID=227086 RepID=A0A6U3FTJ3_BIGNA|mmetsp:Transcript_1443/g.2165  ORF Transcript_1443/g.2165 Transcript_1443/m.2165 type:complete len:249 (+) Transcript_1443:161-907(+)|eukprot:jgi/Bigna1/90213/estExt_fgenesh1_pg.C_650055
MKQTRFALPKNLKSTSKWEAVDEFANSDLAFELRTKITNNLRTTAIFGRLDEIEGADIEEFKVVVIGNKGTGKTSLIFNLCDIQSKDQAPTHGVAEYNAYWPIKLTRGGRPKIVHLQFWDAGIWCLTDESKVLEKRLKEQQAENGDAVLYVCTSTDYKSFSTIQAMIESNSAPVPLPPVRVVVMTRADQWVKRAVGSRDLTSIRKEYAVGTCGISNATSVSPSFEKQDATRLLNMLSCKLLEQRYKDG